MEQKQNTLFTDYFYSQDQDFKGLVKPAEFVQNKKALEFKEKVQNYVRSKIQNPNNLTEKILRQNIEEGILKQDLKLYNLVEIYSSFEDSLLSKLAQILGNVLKDQFLLFDFIQRQGQANQHDWFDWLITQKIRIKQWLSDQTGFDKLRLGKRDQIFQNVFNYNKLGEKFSSFLNECPLTTSYQLTSLILIKCCDLELKTKFDGEMKFQMFSIFSNLSGQLGPTLTEQIKLSGEKHFDQGELAKIGRKIGSKGLILIGNKVGWKNKVLSSQMWLSVFDLML